MRTLRALAEAVRASGAEAVAISLLFSFANPETEQRVEAALRRLGHSGFCVASDSAGVSRIRARVDDGGECVPCAADGALFAGAGGGCAARYAGGRVEVMQSSGGIVAARVGGGEPVRTVLCGPAGGVVGACRVARWAGFDAIIGFDMGGTSRMFLWPMRRQAA